LSGQQYRLMLPEIAAVRMRLSHANEGITYMPRASLSNE